MRQHRIITASLEGARIIVEAGVCHLQEYNFDQNRWCAKDDVIWPAPRARAEEWLWGWNHADRFAAMRVLTTPAAID